MAEPNEESSDPYPTPGLPDPVDTIEPSEQWMRYTRYFYLLCKFLFFGLVAAAAYWLLNTVGDVLFPIFVSLLIAYLLDPAVDWLEDRGLSRTIGIGIWSLIILAGLSVLTLFLYPTVARQVTNIAERIPELIITIQTRTIPWLEARGVDIPPTFEEAVATYGEEFKNAAPALLEQAGEWMTDAITQTGAIVVSLANLILIPIFTFYFLRDFDRMRLAAVEYLPEHNRGFLLDRIRLMDQVVGDWFRGQIQVAGILAVLYAIGLAIAFWAAGIDVTSGVAIGLVTGLLNVVPYFGFAVGLVLGMLVVILEWAGFGPVIGVLAVFMAVQLLESYYITPKVVGEKVGLSPVVVIIVLLIGGELFGLLGILLAIPIAGAIKCLFPDMATWYVKTPFFTGRGVNPIMAVADASPVLATKGSPVATDANLAPPNEAGDPPDGADEPGDGDRAPAEPGDEPGQPRRSDRSAGDDEPDQ